MSTPSLGRLVTEGYANLRASSTADVSPSLRLQIYDALVGSSAISQAVSNHLWSFDTSVGDCARYWRLVLATARHVLPIWDVFFQAPIPDSDVFRRLPHEMVEAAEQMASGARLPSMLDEMDPWTAIGALPYVVNYNTAEVALAAYGALFAVNGKVPFHSLPRGIDLGIASDLALDLHSGNKDTAWHSAEAFSALDYDPVGTDERTKIDYDRENRHEFWEWWLAEVSTLARQ
jgi:hypothetical protein